MPDLHRQSIFGPDDSDRATYVDGKPVVFGQFAMRRFAPVTHPIDWHGHIEFNWLVGGSMTYQFETDQVVLPKGRLCFFWAGIPHQTLKLGPDNADNYQLTNMYFPLDVFLSLRGAGHVQRALLAGAFLAVPEDLVDERMIDRWFGDYESRNLQRFECLTIELQALMRRLALRDTLEDLRIPQTPMLNQEVRAGPTEHVVSMIETVIQNISGQLTTRDIAEATGLNANYASNLFRRYLGITLKQFTIRMRLIRARELLLSSDVSVSEAAFQSGFSSTSQFYSNYRTVYGNSPGELRHA
ncbi:helix-turn-helix domain-containing protein [uncultured Roseibium sp.]|uniref:helix-turn-helix domain-containing protein n=1 Tax=uncultured Roseibium sp. TaxID=1936171 RepID=UPI00261E893A|nr:helix-turn-helix domain-containing protein [uncultured Roseibium sp.]